jgi:hypothetical protein
MPSQEIDLTSQNISRFQQQAATSVGKPNLDKPDP